MTGLYVHIPFCLRKCHYCNFVIALPGASGGPAAYLSALEKESQKAAGSFSGTEMQTLYLGGGTPSTLAADEFEALFKILRAAFVFSRDAEISLEANPGDVEANKASLWKKLGVNRVSLGAQTFHDGTLSALNRSHRSAQTTESFRNLREAGFENISLDLMLSLPGESWQEARASLEQAAALDPEHVSLYELTIEDKTVFGEKHRRGELKLPGEEEQFEILSNARDFLKRRGYRHYELLSYSKPGFESRHNNLYWANQNTLGLGPGAYSYIEGRRSRFARSHEEYLSKISQEDWQPAEDETLDEKKREAESFLLALRLSDGAAVSRFRTAVAEREDEIRRLREKNLLTESEGRIRLTARGQFLAETVFAELA